MPSTQLTRSSLPADATTYRPGTVYTVVVFVGSPRELHLTESYRAHFRTLADAKRFARGTVTRSRTNWATGKTFVPPCASIFEDSPTKGLGAHVGEYNSRARTLFLRSLEVA